MTSVGKTYERPTKLIRFSVNWARPGSCSLAVAGRGNDGVNQEWISANNVLLIVLRDNLHQPQYVEKLEKIVRFMIKEKSLTLEDLDKIWDAQVGMFLTHKH